MDTEPKVADVLYGYGQAAELYRDADGVGYATLPGSVEAVPVRTGRIRRWLREQYRADHGTLPNQTALETAIAALDDEARYGGTQRDVFIRVGHADGAVYLDCHTAVVEVTALGWQPVTDCPVRFRRPSHALPLPLPMPGSLDDLRPLLNAADETHWALLSAFLLGCFMPVGAFPILALHGEKGSGKSNTCLFLKRLVDDDASTKAKAPRDDDRAMLKAYGCWVPCFDNMSGMPSGFSDTLCQLSTGIADSKKKLYTDADEIVFAVKRPVMLNGIPVVGTAPDFLDRVLLLDLPRLSTRRTEADMEAEFQRVRAGVLGALLDAVSAALRTDAQGDWPRMADFCQWVVAAEQGMGWAPRFMTALTDVAENAASLELEASPVVRAIVRLMEKRAVWEGTATDLCRELDSDSYMDEKARNSPAWSKGPNQMGNALTVWASALRDQGITVERPRDKKVRTVRLSRAVTAEDRARAAWDDQPHMRPLDRLPDESDTDWVTRNQAEAKERAQRLRVA